MSLVQYLTRIQFDFGALQLLADELKLLDVARPLLVTDPGLVQLGLAQRALDVLPPAINVTIFDQTPENPTEDAVDAALQAYASAGCDSVIAFGGGSSIDLGKGVALMASHRPPLEDYAAILGGADKITRAVAPLVAIPTTAGTGSEVGRGAILTLRDGRKLGFLSPHLIPRVAICDPELTLGLPPQLTAATGMDAIAHCIETYLSPRDNPVAEAIALDGLKRASRNIRRAVADGTDRQARREMLWAAVMGGLTFQKGLGAVHAMSHPLGGIQEPRLHHGTLNAVILPAVLRFNAGHVGDKYHRLAEAMGLAPEDNLPEAIERLNADLGLPANLKEMGLPREALPTMVEGALADHSNATNPRPVNREDYEALFEEVYG
ncbi:MAG TPA: iron-containing alcohol dehydrogenase [Kiloniellales bacterium]|nr:iron-containing alcohol dehydrogenase [Kiloniellales bacterium]